MNPISPLLLQAQIIVPAGGGSFGVADSTRLTNPFQAPMWLDEIRFRLPTNAHQYAGMRVLLELGETPLTNGFVPIATLGKVLNDSRTNGEFVAVSAEVVPNCFTWKLPKPLFIPAREYLRPTMYFDTFSGAATNPVTIIYCCRPLPKNTPTPQTMQIPWVTYFQPPYLSCSSGTPAVDTINQSTLSDLFNPWDEELHVQRLMGRLLVRGTNSGGDEDNHMSLVSAKVNLTPGQTTSGQVTTGTLVSAQDSFNNILVRDTTPFGHVFDIIDRSWTVNAILPPKGFYLFTVDRLWSNYLPATVVTATVAISMVGWREVVIKRPSFAQPLDTSSMARRQMR